MENDYYYNVKSMEKIHRKLYVCRTISVNLKLMLNNDTDQCNIKKI